MDEELFTIWNEYKSAHPAVVIELEAHYANIEEAAWCDHCMLPSAITFTQLIVNKATLCVLMRREYWMCRDCDRYALVG